MRTYKTFNYPDQVAGSGDKTLLTGIRRVNNRHQVYISGFYEPNQGSTISFIYKGKLNGNGAWYPLGFPSLENQTVTSTSLYGPNNGEILGNIQVVGNYMTEQTGTAALGCIYQGPLDGTGKWTTLLPTADQPVLNTIAHSTMGHLAVGNYDTQLNEGRAFIYDIKSNIYYDIIKDDAESITAYGIWHNGDSSYTICGGYTDIHAATQINVGYLVDWDNERHTLRHWRSYNYDNDPGKAVITHFDGITSDGNGGYNLTGDWVGVDSNKFGFQAHIKRNKCHRFNRHATWAPINYPGYALTSGNSVDRDVVIGVYTDLPNINGFVSFLKK